MITKLPGLPLPPANIDPQLASFLTALAETVEIRTGQRGDKLDRAVTLRELIEGGLATESQSVNFDSANISSGSIGFTGTNGTTLPGGGVSSPVAPLNFTATGLFSAISLSWTYATYFGHSHTEIWRSNTDVFADAFVLGITPQSVYIDPVGGDQTKYYWIRHVNLSGEKGPFFSQTPVSATTATDVDHILTIVSSAITASQLATDLASRIDLIDGVDLDGNPIAGSVAAQVATEAADRVSGIAAEAADRVSGIAAEAADRVSDIAAEAVARAADIATEVTNRGTAISNETDARTEAISSAVSGLATQAAVDAEVTNRGTAISNETDARIAAISNAVSGLATQATVAAEVTNRGTAISNETDARTEAISSAVSGLATQAALAAEVTNRGTAISNETDARAEAISSAVSGLATQATLAAEVTNRGTAISNETDARTEAISNAVSGLATQAAVAAEITNRGTAIGNETDARIAAISNAVSGLATQAAVDAKESVANVNIIKDNLQGQINSLNNTPAWDTNVTYSTDDQVIYEDHIYRALRSTAGDQPDTSTSDWSLLGAYTSLASIIGANSAAITQLNLVDSSSTSSTAKLLSSLSSSVDSLAGAVDAIEGEAWNSSSYFPANSIVRAGLMESIEWAYGSSSAPNLLSYDINERAIRLQDTSDLSVGMVFYAFPVVAGNTYDLTLSYKADRTDSNGVYVRVYEQDATALPAGKAFVSHNASTSADEVEEDTRKASINPSKESIGVTTAFQTLTSTYTPTSTAKWASIVVLNWSSMDPSLWSPSTTYSAGTTIRRDVNSVIRLFESLQGSNSNQDPRTADTYWEDLGPYVPNALFVKDVSVVQKDSSAAVVKEWNYKSRLFKATQASTTKTLDDTTYWEDLGPGDLSGHVKTTKASIDNLTSTFGSTTAAASSASAASDSAIAAASDAADALIYKNDAARSESNASGSASTASTKEGLATNAASAASDSATEAFNHKEAAAQSESNAASSASTASTKEGLATNAASAASDSATEAFNHKEAAAQSKSDAASSASTASNKEGLATSAASAASDSVTAALGHATTAFNHKEAAAQSKSDAAGSASTASDKEGLATSAASAASDSATLAFNHKEAAAQSESNAAGSASTASTKEGLATSAASAASDSATEALGYKEAAGLSESNAAGSASTASTKEGLATNAASAASDSATVAFNHKEAAAQSESNAAGSASTASTKEGLATSAASAASDYATEALGYKDDAARSESNAAGSASTASTKEGLATNAASAASDSATAAFNHKEAAAQSESNAASSASTASNKEGLATSAASAASDSATEALGYKDDAARSESNAASSASTASNKEGLATSAASAASDSATEAFNHKEAAAQSKSDAAGFASTASDKATLATSASTTIYTGGFIGKNTFEDGLTGLWGGGIAAVANAPAGHPLGRTKALHQTSRDSYYLPLTPDSYYSNSAHGKTFRVTGYVYNSSTVGNNSNGGYSSMAARAGLQSRDDQAGREWPTVIAAGIGLNQWVKYDGTFSVDDSNGQRMLPFLQIAGTTVNSDVFSAYWTDMTLTDVTSETNATTQADLASGYATTALGYKDDAARSESNAAGSASTASTKQGLATSAASAATTQAGLASDSATEAFNHKEAAAQSESNAAGSASTASTKEGLATSAASAATTQAGLASNYSSAAFSHKEAAAQSKSDAAGSASAAVNTLSNITASIAGESPVWDHDSTSTSYQVDDYVQAGMLQACVPSYSVDSSSNVSLTYDPVEASLKILSTTDSTTGVAFEAFRTVPSANYRISMSIKNDTSYRSSGLYVRIYRANSLSAGKLYVGHSLLGSNPNFSVIQQQNNMATMNNERYEVPNATGTLVPHVSIENADIGKDWVRCTFDFNASSTYPFASINVLNWSGNSTYPLYVKEVTVTEVLSGGGLGRAWSYDGRRYVCTADTTTNQPLNDTNYWKYLGPTSSSLTSSIRSVNEVSADIDTVVASQTTQLTALNTTVQTTASTSGLMGQFSVKIDANGHVSGFGLATTNAGATPSSAFIVRADKFAIIDPSDTGNALGTTSPDNAILPFVIDDGTTYIKNAMIKDASITAAKIGTVDADTITTGYLSSAIIEAGTIDASKLTINSDTIESFSDTQTGSTGLKIKNLAVRTLHIADGSVFIPRLIEFAAGEYVQTLVGGYDYTFRTLGQSSALDFSDTQLSASIAVYTEWDINYRVQGRTSSSFFNNYTFSSLHRLWLVLRVQDNAMDGSGWITRSTYTLHVEPTPDNNRSTSTFNFNGDKWLILSLADTVNRGNVRFVMDVVGGITGSNFGNGSLTLRLEWENKDVLIMAGKK